uniref:Patatin like phospholipase domain containing 4 n=1 Tax=Rousettus aegyptiacus TaxID=9407 RepID=A0A7J8B7X1_ROUAE|nr:patatin like phospholipase domain containing 4 [Rousettus aegyptiacus]
MKPINLSFSACGFLGIYHLGAASALRRHGRKLLENVLVSSFSSREDLIQVLLASSFVPLFAGLKPVQHRGQRWVDGGLTDSLPILPVGRTVTVSPFSGRSDISPQDKGQLNLRLTVANQDLTKAEVTETADDSGHCDTLRLCFVLLP